PIDLRNDRPFVGPVPEEVLYAAHADFYSAKGLNPRSVEAGGLSRVQAQVFEKLRREFTEYVRGLGEKLDAMLPGQAKFIPNLVYYPKEIPPLLTEESQGDKLLRLSGRRVQARPLQVVVDLPRAS